MSVHDSQLQEDLDRRINDRLAVWARDSAGLYEMAGLSAHAAATDIFAAVFHFAIRGANALDIDGPELAHWVVKCLDLMRERDEQKAKKRRRS
jgi:hypothetical protein